MVKSWSVSEPAQLRGVFAEAVAWRPTLVDVITQPLHEANAPVSEWVARFANERIRGPTQEAVMSGKIDARMKELGITLPAPGEPAGTTSVSS
jgi:hypothetical protein